jgi:hypothetical protein
MDCGNIANRVKTRRKMKKIEKKTEGLEDACKILSELLEQEQNLSGQTSDLCDLIEKQRKFIYDKWNIEWLVVDEL